METISTKVVTRKRILKEKKQEIFRGFEKITGKNRQCLGKTETVKLVAEIFSVKFAGVLECFSNFKIIPIQRRRCR